MMNLELNVNELGTLLKKIEEKNPLDILIKSNLNGGWMTLNGKATIEKIPGENKSTCGGNKDNIIHIKVGDDNNEGIIVKLTGANNKKFNIEISKARYREISPNNLTINQIKESDKETKLKIDDNIIFSIKDNIDNIIGIIK